MSSDGRASLELVSPRLVNAHLALRSATWSQILTCCISLCEMEVSPPQHLIGLLLRRQHVGWHRVLVERVASCMVVRCSGCLGLRWLGQDRCWAFVPCRRSRRGASLASRCMCTAFLARPPGRLPRPWAPFPTPPSRLAKAPRVRRVDARPGFITIMIERAQGCSFAIFANSMTAARPIRKATPTHSYPSWACSWICDNPHPAATPKG